ncbi:E3 ubiquitin-protein ligase RING1 [Apostasia shenzhenica]|uniref:RING-type E3 ubiquitin transferase n=1 Tax=Apostasia shenzhenica TaxID=1088818 RepID=A0A2I0A9D4_9ASPA|nr:E3 ubiquitin-protein ligase RING1 [Apostasia shenzhenica]
MSSAGPGTGGGDAVLRRYFCHQCNRTVTIVPPADGELACSVCHGGFIEEFESQSPNPISSPPLFSFAPAPLPFFPPTSQSPIFLSRSASFDLRHPSDVLSLIGPESGLFRSPSASSDAGVFSSPSSNSEPGPFSSPATGTEPFNPVEFLQRYIETLLSDGANIQIVLEGGDRPIGNLGDYFIGPGLEQLIQQLADNDPNRYGTPPAAKFAVNSLPDFKITEDLLSSDEAQCAVCKDAFEIGEEAKQMPCKHIFHKDCILPWLELHNSCPVCRYELLTDDPDYEQRKGGRNQAPRSTAGTDRIGLSGADGPPGGSGERNAAGQRSSPVERRFTISLPWPFRGLGFQGEASSGGDEQGGAGGGNNESFDGQGASGSERRHEATE